MFRGVLAAALLLGTAPVAAETYYASVSGVVTSELDTGFTAPGATSPIKVGDTITATFSYMTPGSVGEALASALGWVGPKKVVFQLGGFTWTSAGDFGTSLEPVSFEGVADPLANYYSTMDDAPGGGDLHVDGYDFEVGEFGYGLYTGPGFKGTFDRSTLVAYLNGERLPSPFLTPQTASADSVAAPVPEPTAWALMIAGFGLAGAAVRRRKAIPARA